MKYGFWDAVKIGAGLTIGAGLVYITSFALMAIFTIVLV